METEQSVAKKRIDWTSLRVRLIASYILITFISFFVMGVVGVYRSQKNSAYLISELQKNVSQQASNDLESASQLQAVELNNFFAEIQKNLTQIGKTLENILSSQISLGQDQYWNAASSLQRLPNNSWDNPNEEAASIFIPAQIELTDDLVTELNAVRKLDLLVPPFLETNPDIVAFYFGGTRGETIYYPNIDLAAIVPNDFDITKRPWYLEAVPWKNPQKQVAWSAPYLDAALNGLVVTSSLPIYDQQGTFRGVVAADIQLSRISSIISQIKIGETGYAFLLDKHKHVIAMSASAYSDLGADTSSLPLGEVLEPQRLKADISNEFWQVVDSMASGKSGLQLVTINGIERFVVYKPITVVDYSLAIIVPVQELLANAIAANEQIARTARITGLTGILLAMGVLVLTLIATQQISNWLTKPLLALTKVAKEIEQGNLNAVVPVEGSGEIGALAQSFQSMTAQLREIIRDLEQRVAERTRALERRNELMRAALEVGSAAVSVRDPGILLPRIAHLISQRFGFYHVGIFLLDERQEYAVLRASNSRGGQVMLARGHKLRVGQEGIVGYVAATGEARIALDVGEDKVYFQNPDLPETRSEATLPLIANGEVIGALDVQSTEEAAFEEADLVILQVLADQIAIALENARLFTQTQNALEAIQRAYGETSRMGWHALYEQANRPLGYLITSRGKIVSLSDASLPAEHKQAMETGKPVLSEDKKMLYVPIRVSGYPVGVLRLKQSKDAIWTSQDINAINSLAAQMGTALESARLYKQIRDQAQRESIIATITSQIGSSVDIETILQTTAQEIGRLFENAEILLQLKSPETLSESSPEEN
jgi:GAF domain-containing protein